MMDSIDFTVARIKSMWGARVTPEFLAEIAFLYDHIVRTGTKEPVIDLGMKLMIPFEQVGEIVAHAIEEGFISAPKRGTWGGTITKKSLKILGQIEPQKRRKRIDRNRHDADCRKDCESANPTNSRQTKVFNGWWLKNQNADKPEYRHK